MHADIQELLTLRDEATVDPEVRRHIKNCTECSLALAQLQRLKTDMLQLPMLPAPPHSWTGIRERLRQAPSRSSRYWPALSAVAAMALCVVGAYQWLTRHEIGLAHQSSVVARDNGAIGPLVAHSQRLEALLHALPPRPRVEQAVTSATIDELEIRIQMLDLQLSGVAGKGANPEQLQSLWNARVQLLNSLVYVRFAETAGDGFRSPYPLELGVI